MRTFVLAAPTLLMACLYGPGEPRDVHIEGHVIELRPNRDDVSVGAATLITRCLKQPRTSEDFAECDGFEVDDHDVDGPHEYVELDEVGPNEFELAPLDIEYTSARGGYLCVALKLSLNEVTNACDSDFYVDRDDRYSIVSYCTVAVQPSWAQAHIYDFNRVEGLRDLSDALEVGFEVLLDDGPLPQPTDPDDPNSGCSG